MYFQIEYNNRIGVVRYDIGLGLGTIVDTTSHIFERVKVYRGVVELSNCTLILIGYPKGEQQDKT